MTEYRVSLRVWPVPTYAHRLMVAPCAQRAACELGTPYVEAGLVVDWRVRRVGVHRFGRRWSGRFVPGDDDGLAGVREPRRPWPSAGSAAAAIEAPAA